MNMPLISSSRLLLDYFIRIKYQGREWTTGIECARKTGDMGSQIEDVILTII
jgi:hypothetical protein